MALEQELRTFKRELPNLLLNPESCGKFALVHGNRVNSVWPSVDTALDAGYERYGLKPFLVMEITEHERSRYCSHDISPSQEDDD